MTESPLGVSVPVDGVALAELPALARRVEDLGYTDLWSMESNGFDAFTPLAAAAAATSRIRLGTAIVPVFTRPAGLLAMHAAAMAELAPGRFVLGLGSSTRTVVETWMGIPFSRPLTRTRQTVGEVRALLAGERVGALRLSRRPASPVPIYMAGLGDGMLRTAGEVADGVVFFLTGPRILPRLLSTVEAAIDSVARVVVVPSREREALELARRQLTSYALVPYYARSLRRQGFGEEVDAIRERWAAGDRAAAPGQVSDAMIRELMLVGGPDEIREGLEAYRRAGLRTPVVALAGGDGAGPGPLLAELVKP